MGQDYLGAMAEPALRWMAATNGAAPLVEKYAGVGGTRMQNKSGLIIIRR